MKKIFLPIFVIAFGLCGVLACTPASNVSAAEELPQIQEISDENAFYNLIKTTSEQNATKDNGEKTKLNIKLTDNLDFSEKTNLIFQDFSFYGLLDGNGYSISNIQISATNGTNYGLFATANGQIKNLRIEGSVTYKFNDSLVKNVGVIVGSAINSTIEHCEIDVDYQTQTESAELGLSIQSNMLFGSVAGYLDGCLVSNCINFSNVYCNASGVVEINIGGLVGEQKSGQILYTTNYGTITFQEGAAQQIQVHCGGIIGHVDAGTISMKNCAADGRIITNQTNARVGALVGYLSDIANYDENGSVIDYCYFTKLAQAFGYNYTMTQRQNCKQIEALTIDFFKNNENWSKSIDEFDFNDEYMNVNGKLRLQVFQSFDFKISDGLDNRLTFLKIDGAGTETPKQLSVKYGRPVKIYLKYTNDKFYSLPSVRRIGDSIDAASYQMTKDSSGQIELTILKSSYQTQGTYTFDAVPIEFTCVVEADDQTHGTVKWGTRNSRTLTYGQTVTQITANGIGPYDFEYWELYTGSVKNGEIEWSDSPDASFKNSEFYGHDKIYTNDKGQFVFGEKAPFDQNFKLVAVFTQNSAIHLTFNSDKNISKILVGDVEYVGEEILVSPRDTVQINVTVKKGFDLNLSSLQTEPYTDDPLTNEDGSKTYKLRLNMGNIQAIDKAFTLKLTTVERKDDSGNNLLWLWILIPCVVVLAGGIVLTIFLVRRQRIYGQLAKNGAGGKAKTTKQKQEKKPDYKDYYY